MNVKVYCILPVGDLNMRCAADAQCVVHNPIPAIKPPMSTLPLVTGCESQSGTFFHFGIARKPYVVEARSRALREQKSWAKNLLDAELLAINLPREQLGRQTC